MAKKIVVMGTGYVGLPLAIILARSGYQVIGVDIEEKVVDAINEGVLHIAEQDIQHIFQEPEVRANLQGRKSPTQADVFIISVPTPLDEEKRSADLSQVIDSTRAILPFLERGNLVILESTVPPLTCRQVLIPLIEENGLKVREDVFLCHCPERVLPGDVFYEIVHNDRILGGTCAQATQMAKELYASFCVGNLYTTDDVTAELVKLLENTYRGVNIALANELAGVAEGLGVNIMEAINLANKHPRVSLLYPGIGTGGHCIPVDPWFIKQVDPVNSRLIHTACLINEEVPAKIAAKIRRMLNDIPKPKIVALGASYKPNTYDVRNSPALRIVALLREEGYQVEVYDPLVESLGYSSIAEIATGADCLAVLVEHDVIRQELAQDEDRIRALMRRGIILRFYPDKPICPEPVSAYPGHPRD